MGVQSPLFVAVAQVELHLPGARSLKDKRQDVRSLIERLRHRLAVLVVESDHQELHQRAALAVSALATDAAGRALDGAARPTPKRRAGQWCGPATWSTRTSPVLFSTRASRSFRFARG